MQVVFTGGGTGGHLYPALAIARALMALEPGTDIQFVGARRGIEARVLPTAGFPYILLDLHPAYRAQPWKNWLTIRGMATAWSALGRTYGARHPDLVVGTGGYASAATLGWSMRHGVPIVLQEQNSLPGWTTRLFSRWARAVYLGFPEAAAHLARRDRAIPTGNPVEPPPDPRPVRAAARRSWGFPDTGGRVLLIFGGSQGSAAINAIVDRWLARGLPNDMFVIWATGPGHFAHYAGRASSRVVVRDYLAPIADAYAACDLALTRAGAMTTAELCAWGLPSILIPLPTAAADHQTANARSLSAAGVARWIPEREASAERIDAEVRSLVADDSALGALAKQAAARGRPAAARDIAGRIVSLLHSSGSG